MKKFTAILLAVLLMGMAACDLVRFDSTESCAPANTSAEDAPKHLERLKAAWEKTKRAKSFVMEVCVSQKIGGQSMTATDKYAVRVGENGACTVLAESDINKKYYSGHVGYEFYSGSALKHIYAEPFELSAFTGMVGVIPTNPGFLADFCGWNPKKSAAEDGSVSYAVNDLSPESFTRLMEGPTPSEEDTAAVSNIVTALKIDSNGCLTGFRYSGQVSRGDRTAELAVSLELSRLGEEPEINEPEFIGQYHEKYDWDDVYYHENGYFAMYSIRSFYGSGYRFKVLGSNTGKPVHIPVYRILSEVEGVPVKEVWIGSSWWADVHLDKLVLPESIESVQISNACHMENTELFFMCGRDSLDEELLRFNVLDDENPNSDYGSVKAVYFAGEWENVNGVPTPIR